MCNTTALMVTQIATAGLQYKMQTQQARNQYAQQKRQNELAKSNAIQRNAAEQLKIRQVVQRFSDKEYEDGCFLSLSWSVLPLSYSHILFYKIF